MADIQDGQQYIKVGTLPLFMGKGLSFGCNSLSLTVKSYSSNFYDFW